MGNQISGNVGVANATVTLSGRTINGPVFVQGASDASGNFSFAGLAAGTYVIRAASANKGFNAVTVTIAGADQSNTNLGSAAIGAGPTALDSVGHRPNGR
jgi:hypothetical protein